MVNNCVSIRRPHHGIVHGDCHINADTPVELLKSVTGSCYMMEGAVAPMLETVGGDFVVYDGAVAPMLETVGGRVDADNHESVPMLHDNGYKGVGYDVTVRNLSGRYFMRGVIMEFELITRMTMVIEARQTVGKVEVCKVRHFSGHTLDRMFKCYVAMSGCHVGNGPTIEEAIADVNRLSC